jgi:flagellar basal body rod protein FlgG
MSDAITEGYTALESRMRQLEVVANNLANARTPGFKRDFARILETETGKDLATFPDLKPGDMMATGNDLDAAIDGPGFFVIQTPDGIRYTRAGNFVVNADGDLVNKDGHAVLSTSNSPINAGAGTVSIGNGGTVAVDGIEAAKLRIVNFRRTDPLEKEGFSRYIWRGGPEEVFDVPEPRVTGGYLESSNVNAVDEMVNMIAAYRDFESVQRMIKTNGDMTARLIQELGKLT